MDREQLITNTRALLERARGQGLRIATRWEREEGDPRHIHFAYSEGSGHYGPALASIEWFGEELQGDEDALIRLFVEGAIRQKAEREREARLRAIHEAHYARWLADPVNVSYRVPDELLREVGL